MVVMIMEAAAWMGIELLGLQECGRCNAMVLLAAPQRSKFCLCLWPL
jgi:hypothetical protein